jgi:hypothetical protein
LLAEANVEVCCQYPTSCIILNEKSETLFLVFVVDENQKVNISEKLSN